jgi:hypothetical protein
MIACFRKRERPRTMIVPKDIQINLWEVKMSSAKSTSKGLNVWIKNKKMIKIKVIR